MTYDVDAGDRVHGQSELRTVDDAAMVAVAMANDLKHGMWVTHGDWPEGVRVDVPAQSTQQDIAMRIAQESRAQRPMTEEI